MWYLDQWHIKLNKSSITLVLATYTFGQYKNKYKQEEGTSCKGRNTTTCRVLKYVPPTYPKWKPSNLPWNKHSLHTVAFNQPEFKKCIGGTEHSHQPPISNISQHNVQNN